MRAVVIPGAAALLLFAGEVLWLWPLEPNVVALQLSFTPQAFGAVIHAWQAQGADHLARFRSMLPVDGLVLIAYGLFGWRLATRTQLFIDAPPRLQVLARWALPAAALADAAENLLHAWLTAAPRFGLPAVYAWSGSVALLKWLLLAAFGGLVVYALLGRLDR